MQWSGQVVLVRYSLVLVQDLPSKRNLKLLNIIIM